ncbi:DUF6206 family protein [Streptomyces sp. C1-1]|uniref:DUF6206 family protein n=1 Tax=Streptomyces sp. C1-1 TaxID=3231173 RepID=UPI003D08B5F9
MRAASAVRTRNWILRTDTGGYACKRLPVFPDRERFERYRSGLDEYLRCFTDSGLTVADTELWHAHQPNGLLGDPRSVRHQPGTAARTAAWPRPAGTGRSPHSPLHSGLTHTTAAGGSRRPLPSGPPPPVQPPDRPAPSLSDHPPEIRRSGRLRATGTAITRHSYLTPSLHGVSCPCGPGWGGRVAGPMRGTRTFSSTGSTCGESPRRPAVTTIDIGF